MSERRIGSVRISSSLRSAGFDRYSATSSAPRRARYCPARSSRQTASASSSVFTPRAGTLLLRLRGGVGRSPLYYLLVAADPSQLPAPETLSDAELRAIVAAATWYAKYHEPMIAKHADDDSALGSSKRDHFESLHTALRKLGVRLRPPAVLAQR